MAIDLLYITPILQLCWNPGLPQRSSCWWLCSRPLSDPLSMHGPTCGSTGRGRSKPKYPSKGPGQKTPTILSDVKKHPDTAAGGACAYLGISSFSAVSCGEYE